MRSLFGGCNKGERHQQGPLSGKTIIVDDFTVKVGSLIGEGGFASVYHAVLVQDNTATNLLLRDAGVTSFALKHYCLRRDIDEEEEQYIMIQREISILQALSSNRHVTRLHASSMDDQNAYLLMELYGESLASYVQSGRSKEWDDEEVLNVVRQVALGLRALHSELDLVHRDLKAENVLLNQRTGEWVLCDFGSASHDNMIYSSQIERSREEDRIRKHTTAAYRAPELWDLISSAKTPIGKPVDIFSLGVLTYYLSYSKLPFDNGLQILNGKCSPPDQRRSERLCALIDMLLESDPIKRPKIKACIDMIDQTKNKKVEETEDVWEATFEDVQQYTEESQQKQQQPCKEQLYAEKSDGELQTNMEEQQQKTKQQHRVPNFSALIETPSSSIDITNSSLLEEAQMEHCRVLEGLLEQQQKEYKRVVGMAQEQQNTIDRLQTTCKMNNEEIRRLRDELDKIKRREKIGSRHTISSFPVPASDGQQAAAPIQNNTDDHSFSDLDPFASR